MLYFPTSFYRSVKDRTYYGILLYLTFYIIYKIKVMFLQNWYPRETSLLFTGRQMFLRLCKVSQHLVKANLSCHRHEKKGLFFSKSHNSVRTKLKLLCKTFANLSYYDESKIWGRMCGRRRCWWVRIDFLIEIYR
jgi:hypothetical protein